MLIRDAEIEAGRRVDLRVETGRVAQIGSGLAARDDEETVDARGAALLPGLHDHHLHLRAFAASLASVRCGPPQVRDRETLAAALQAAAGRLAPGAWLRGIGYHESVAGELDREQLDAWVPDRPLRIQQRSGRLWILNSAALDRLAPQADAPLERIAGRWSGRLYDADDWLRTRLPPSTLDLATASRWLASRGVTGVTDTTHHNGPEALQGFADAHARGELLQAVRAMGDARLDTAADLPGVERGEHKFHLHEHELPDLDETVAAIRRSHAQGRACAFHCVTRTELVYVLAALREAGPLTGDRIEHAAVAPPELVEEIAALGLTVVTQPNFIAERGDDYLRDVDAADQPWLYRLRGFVDAGVPLALSTDAPFGDADPWAALAAAVSRRTPAGRVVNPAEALDATAALGMFLSPLENPRGKPRRVTMGAVADLCLLEGTFSALYREPAAVRCGKTWIGGHCVFDRNGRIGAGTD